MEQEKTIIERGETHYRKFISIDKRTSKADFYFYNLSGVLYSYFGQKYNVITGHYEYISRHFKNKVNFGQTKISVNKSYIEKIFKLNLSTQTLSDEEMKKAKWNL